MMVLAFISAYAMRANLSITIIEMVKPINASTHSPSMNSTEGEIACPADQKSKSSFEFYDDGFFHPSYVSEIAFSEATPSNGQDTSDRYDWSQELQGIILSSFYWGYLVSHLPGGILAQKFGGKPVLGFGILCCGLTSLVTPFCVKIGIV